MELGLIERLFLELFGSGRVAPEVTVVWHLGEPLILPPSYYEEAINLIVGLRDGFAGDSISVRFKIQTNGVLINDDWCSFFKRHEELLDVGVSCDGPAELHDAYRLNRNGAATHSKTVHGMELLQKNGIKYKIIAVVTKETLSHPDAFYNYFFDRRQYLSDFHFNIIAEAVWDNQALAYFVDDRELYYSFYRRLLELSHKADESGADFKILNFSQGLERILASQSANAQIYIEETTAPLKTLTIDTYGNVATFYAGLGIEVLPDLYGDGKGFSIGNIADMSFEDMVRSEKLQRMIGDFEISTQSCKRSCEYFPVCSGGYEITKKLTLGTFDASETTECVIHVKTLVDALLDDVCDHLDERSAPALAS